MPVNLKQIPDEEPLPTPPAKSRWLLVIILCVITGAMMVLSFWPKNLSTHSAWFWCCVLMLPSGAGLTAYIIRLRHYENERDRTLWWNHLHQQQRKEHISAGQKAVGILGMSYFTPVASNKLSQALLCGVEGLNSHYSPALQATVSAALLSPSLKTLTKASYQYRLESNLSGVLRQLASELNQYEGNLLVRLRHDGILHDDQVRCLSGRMLAVAIRSEGAPAAVILGLTRGNQQNAIALADGDPGLHPFTAGCRNVAFPLNGVLCRVFFITPKINIRLE